MIKKSELRIKLNYFLGMRKSPKIEQIFPLAGKWVTRFQKMEICEK